jgi:2-polyprenyl-6-methoxyphenol hydroxylase-like FAD-dependent oxidoreductase
VSKRYDAIVVGARCAGSPTSMLLARRGYSVLMVDRATFPSDTVSTHVIHPRGVAALLRWGLLDALVATGCPPIHTYSYDFGPFAIAGAPGTQASPVSYCPRRTVLDKLLIDAAADAGAEVREGFIVDELLTDQGRVVGIRGHTLDGKVFEENAAVVIGADGRRSHVAEAVHAKRYREKPALMDSYYTYWSGLPTNGRFEVYIRPERGVGVMPTHGDLTLVIVGWPVSQSAANRAEFEAHYLQAIGLASGLAERMRDAKRVEGFSSAAVPNYFRRSFGPGWALVGDAGYTRDPITAQGISDAFTDAERCTTALDAAFGGNRSFDDAMTDSQRSRDESVLPMYEMTCELAQLQPPPERTQQLLAAIHGNRQAMDGFVAMNAGTISPAEFFAPENVGAILSAASTRTH